MGRTRVPKTLLRQVRELENQLFLLRTHLHGLAEDPAHLNDLAAGLRVLLCLSSGTDGLIWRLAEKLKVSDELQLHVTRGVDPDHPLAKGLRLAVAPLLRPDPEVTAKGLPCQTLTFREVIKEFSAVYAIGRNYTFEELIKMVAEQIGSAHADEGIEPGLSVVEEIFINGVAPYTEILAKVAAITLEIGDRIITAAEQRQGYPRLRHSAAWTLSLQMSLREVPLGRVPLIEFSSDTAGLKGQAHLSPRSIAFSFSKLNIEQARVETPLPDDWQIGQDAAFCVSYDHAAREIQALSPGTTGQSINCDLGLVDGREISLGPDPDCRPYVNLKAAYLHIRVFSPEEVRQLPELLIEPPLFEP